MKIILRGYYGTLLRDGVCEVLQFVFTVYYYYLFFLV